MKNLDLSKLEKSLMHPNTFLMNVPDEENDEGTGIEGLRSPQMTFEPLTKNDEPEPKLAKPVELKLTAKGGLPLPGWDLGAK